MVRTFLACVLGLFMVGCEQEPAATPNVIEFGGDRPVFLDVPTDYDHATPTPLIVYLHGYGGGGYFESRWTGVHNLIEEQGVLFLAPEGAIDAAGKSYWNAFPTCCAGRGDPPLPAVDDVAYLGGLVEDVSAVWNVDPNRVYFMGHSNGGWMAYRMACERADLIAAIAPSAASLYDDPAFCNPSEQVSALHIHGALDDAVPYDGDVGQPGAVASIELWASYNGCQPTRTAASPDYIDIEEARAGAETRVEQITDCPTGITHELWTMEDVGHTPAWNQQYHSLVYDWLAAHAKP